MGYRVIAVRDALNDSSPLNTSRRKPAKIGACDTPASFLWAMDILPAGLVRRRQHIAHGSSNLRNSPGFRYSPNDSRSPFAGIAGEDWLWRTVQHQGYGYTSPDQFEGDRIKPGSAHAGRCRAVDPDRVRLRQVQGANSPWGAIEDRHRDRKQGDTSHDRVRRQCGLHATDQCHREMAECNSPRWLKLKVAGVGVAEDWTFSGTLEPPDRNHIVMNELWPGWTTILRLMAEQAKSALQSGATAIRSVCIAGEAGTVSAAGVVAAATGAALVGIAWTAFGLYSCGKALAEGGVWRSVTPSAMATPGCWPR